MEVRVESIRLSCFCSGNPGVGKKHLGKEAGFFGRRELS